MSSPAHSLRSARTPFDERPFLAIWETTQACDLACLHCRACAVPHRDANELSTEEAFVMLRQFSELGVPLVVLTGGDPANRPDLVDIVREGTRLGITMAVTPSGTEKTTSDLLKGMRDAGLARLAVSLDGADRETHDQFRGVQGSYAHTDRILRDARTLGIERQINTTIGRHNHHQLGELARVVADYGAVLWSVFFVVPTGRATSLDALSADEIETFLEGLSALADQVSFDIKTTAAPQFRRVRMLAKSNPTILGVHTDIDRDGVVKGMRGINDGTGMLFVSHQGDIYPSGFLPIKAGNLREESIASIYQNSPVFQSIRQIDALEGKCGECPFRLVCGGSRAKAFAMTGNMLGEDPCCAYIPPKSLLKRKQTESTQTTEG